MLLRNCQKIRESVHSDEETESGDRKERMKRKKRRNQLVIMVALYLIVLERKARVLLFQFNLDVRF